MNPRVTDVQPRDNYTLNVAFETGELRRFDATPYLAAACSGGSENGRCSRQRGSWPDPWRGPSRSTSATTPSISQATQTCLASHSTHGWAASIGRTIGLGVRILVLGESHYGTANNVCTTFTSDLVREWTKKGTGRFFPSCPGFFWGSTRVAGLMPRDGPGFGNTWRSTITSRNSLATTNASDPIMKCGNQRRSPFVASSMN